VFLVIDRKFTLTVEEKTKRMVGFLSRGAGEWFV